MILDARSLYAYQPGLLLKLKNSGRYSLPLDDKISATWKPIEITGWTSMGITQSSNWKKLRAGDVILVALVCAAAVSSMVLVVNARAGVKGSIAIIEVNCKEVNRVKLGDDLESRTIEVEGAIGTSVVEVKGGKARMLDSPCREKICVGTGWVETAGDQIVCLPNRVVIRIVGGDGLDDVDAVTE